ncbi:Uncharacterised protein [Mycobacterium tuberculosis]|nr:Uncharacterised protein [Mycobacterium tuberculosis]
MGSMCFAAACPRCRRTPELAAPRAERDGPWRSGEKGSRESHRCVERGEGRSSPPPADRTARPTGSRCTRPTSNIGPGTVAAAPRRPDRNRFPPADRGTTRCAVWKKLCLVGRRAFGESQCHLRSEHAERARQVMDGRSCLLRSRAAGEPGEHSPTPTAIGSFSTASSSSIRMIWPPGTRSKPGYCVSSPSRSRSPLGMGAPSDSGSGTARAGVEPARPRPAGRSAGSVSGQHRGVVLLSHP